MQPKHHTKIRVTLLGITRYSAASMPHGISYSFKAKMLQLHKSSPFDVWTVSALLCNDGNYILLKFCNVKKK